MGPCCWLLGTKIGPAESHVLTFQKPEIRSFRATPAMLNTAAQLSKIGPLPSPAPRDRVWQRANQSVSLPPAHPNPVCWTNSTMSVRAVICKGPSSFGPGNPWLTHATELYGAGMQLRGRGRAPWLV